VLLLNQELREALKTEKYPPGVDMRVVDWVRCPTAETRCVACGEEYSKVTDCGNYCLYCYMRLPSCECEDCPRPAMDVSKLRNKKVWIRRCREHYYGAEPESELEDEYRILFSSHTNGITY
jgi:hypothetical protein